MPNQACPLEDTAHALENEMQETLELIKSLSNMQERLQEVSGKLDQLALEAILHYEELFT